MGHSDTPGSPPGPIPPPLLTSDATMQIMKGDPIKVKLEDAATIKMVPVNGIHTAMGGGEINGTSEFVEWDEDFTQWSPVIPAADLAYRANLVRLYTKTIRIDVPMVKLASEAMITARYEAAYWDIVPVNSDNYPLLTSMQYGSLDGNVSTEYLEDRVREALRVGKPVYQKRIHTHDAAYTQGLHPTHELAALETLENKGYSRLGKAVENEEINSVRYRTSILVVLDEDFEAWADEGTGNEEHHSLFSDALLRA